MGGGRRQEGELLVGEAGRRLKERACGLCGQQQLGRDDAALAIGQRASAFIQSCGQSFKIKKKKKSTPDGFVFSATHLKKTNDTAGVLSREAGRGNISIHWQDK